MRQFLVLIFCLFIYSLRAQSVFYSENIEKDNQANTLELEIYNLNFIKNNEYFNYIADGYSLLGTQLYPEIIYNSTSKTQFRTGIFLLKNYGTDKIESVIPTFSFKYKSDFNSFTFGNTISKNNHQLIEPMMASEKILGSKVIETGIDYLYKNKNKKINVWINWENYIKKNDDNREVFTMGGSSNFTLFKNEKSKLSIPIQYVYYHRGGQINKKFRTSSNLDSVLNFQNLALGLRYKYQTLSNLKINLGYYFLIHKLNTNKQEFPFTSGSAQYVILDIGLRSVNFSLGYYISNKFISAKGNDMFQSYSVKIDNNYWNGILDNRYATHTEPDKSLFLGIFKYQKKLSETIKLGFQAEAYYQLNDAVIKTLPILGNKKHQFDYSYGLYLIFNDFGF